MSNQPSNRNAETSQPRLGVVHLLGWTLGCAVALAGIRLATEEMNAPEELAAQTKLQQLAFGILYGTVLSGLGLLAWRRWRGGYPFPTQPGHWLLVLGGCGAILDAVATATIVAYFRWCAQNNAPIDVTVHYVHRGATWGIAAAVAFIVCWKVRHTADWHWRMVAEVAAVVLLFESAAWLALAAGCRAAMSGKFAMGQWAYMAPTACELIGAFVCSIVVIFTVFLDWRGSQAADRDWLHWAGVAAAVGLSILHVALSGWNLALWLQ